MQVLYCARHRYDLFLFRHHQRTVFPARRRHADGNPDRGREGAFAGAFMLLRQRAIGLLFGMRGGEEFRKGLASLSRKHGEAPRSVSP